MAQIDFEKYNGIAGKPVQFASIEDDKTKSVGEIGEFYH